MHRFPRKGATRNNVSFVLDLSVTNYFHVHAVIANAQNIIKCNLVELYRLYTTQVIHRENDGLFCTLTHSGIKINVETPTVS